MNNKAIVLHDYFSMKGGGERVALTLSSEFGMDLGFGFASGESFDLSELRVKTYDLHAQTRIRGLKSVFLTKAFRYNTKWLSDYQTVIYSGIESVYAVQNHLCGKNIYYCHTPPRYMYDLYDYYLPDGALAKVFQKIRIAIYKPYYEKCIRSMDTVIANSYNVKDRLKRYLGIESVVVHPPCDNKFRYIGQQPYYLSTARLDKLKRVEVIIAAFKMMPDKNLVVCSSGPEELNLREMALGHDNISFTGDIPDRNLAELIGNCIATIYIPVNEDFGMSPIESMASGKPVIGVNEGGLTETILEDETGTLLPSKILPEHIVDAVYKYTPDICLDMRESCEIHARNFSADKFIKKMNHIIVQ